MVTDDGCQNYLFKEIDIIEGIVDRMASNSFTIKGWTLTLVVGTLLLGVRPNQTLIAFIPLASFWYLDAYYLRKERLYRRLYAWVIQNRLSTHEHLLSMDTARVEKEVPSVCELMRSCSLAWFYGSITFLTLIYWLIAIW